MTAKPDRVAKLTGVTSPELTAGYRETVDLTTFAADGYDEIVAVSRLPFYSLCEHHMLPFHGYAHIAYLPGSRIRGLSKFARLVDLYARRLQLQERLTSQIAERLVDELDPRGVVVVIEAEHLCMTMRGVQKPVSYTRTSVVRGIFREKPKRAPKPSSCSELPDDPASARATRRSHERYRLRSNQPASRQ